MKTPALKKFLLSLLPFAATALILTVIQPPIDWAPLAWVAFVPFILACSPKARPGRLFLLTFLASLAYWLANLYWVVPITIIGWLAFCLYTALLWPVLALGLRFCRARKLPLFLAAAVLVVGTECTQGLFLGGFFWRFLGHSQYRNITLIQIADIFGAGGVSFLVAMVNGLIAQLIIAVRQKKLRHPANLAGALLVVLAVVAAVAYGRWQIHRLADFVTPGPVVASVQSNIPQHTKRSFKNEQKIFDELMLHSKDAAKTDARLIVWPETMVQATLSSQVLGLLESSHRYRLLDTALAEHAKDNAFVLVGAYGGVPHIQEDFTIILVKRYNSAFLYTPDGRRSDAQYNKIHLVPFGEVLPFRKSWPALYNLLMKFTPYNFDYSLDYGSQYTVFEMTAPPDAPNDTNTPDDPNTPNANPRTPDANAPARAYRFGVMICYEDVVPAIARGFALDKQGRKQIDFLLNISNDGWFVRFEDDSEKVYPSAELPQHAAICAFRAVENRLTVVRSVNTGISCLIDSAGRIRDGFHHGTLPEKAMDRTGMAGWFTDTIPIDTRTTFFSRHGAWLDFCCQLLVLALIITLFAARLSEIKKQKTRLPRRSNEKRKPKS